MHRENPLALLEIHVAVYTLSVFLRKRMKSCSHIGFGKREYWLTELVNGLKHCTKLETVSIQTPQGTPSRLSLLKKLFLTFKLNKVKRTQWLTLDYWGCLLDNISKICHRTVREQVKKTCSKKREFRCI